MTLQSLTQTKGDSSQNLDYDVVIVGANITGLTLAVTLQQSNLRVAIVEATPLDVTAQRDRAYAISVFSGRIFAGLGVWENIEPKIGKFRQIRLSDGQFPQVVAFETEDINSEYLGYAAEHYVLHTALQKRLESSENIQWLCPAKVESIEHQDQSVKIRVSQGGKEEIITTRLIVGADGARSRVRENANIKTMGWNYWQSCVTTVFHHQTTPNDTAFERFWHTGPMGILPLPGNRCQVVWTAPHEEAQRLQAMDEKQFIEKLTQRTGGSLADIELLKDRLVFPVQLMQSNRYVLPNLALIGDAAHRCHPVGGQGLNLGIRDAAVLGEILQQASDRGEDIGEIQVLKRYQRWRKTENLAILGLTDLLDRSFSNQFLPMVLSRRAGIWMMRNVPPLKRLALEIMTGLKGKSPVLTKTS
ncbi:FAD-dependent hydroxylase [Dactylococcopsis salina]|uniref:Ubiquinone biosynthesis hydroxylase, UbiH/UbiF/VisC/COQ6 family n=1 Tax=Dactylococcopsis salina (strain PCC 8305) TaxID=13035 RepID=K9YUJ6_DACS8|nr:FAD-dependent hydroxylase [Dactylococcopsis salina]AFZ49768.1 Ubiquinone biosynthesis hydroxylase, UbiH/UbiF/VisC/COQ6 family [Dactylococcopsis salina PCC 8305]